MEVRWGPLLVSAGFAASGRVTHFTAEVSLSMAAVRSHTRAYVNGTARLEAQGNVLIQMEGWIWLHRECHWQSKNVPAGQSHVIEDTLVVGLTHKAIKGREGARGQQLEIADGTFRQLHGWQLASVSFEIIAFLGRHHEINQRAAIWSN